jgi:lipase ATG15
MFDLLTYDMVYDLAKISRNVYYKLEDRWLNVSLPQVFDTSIDNDTVRSYLFTNSDNSINVIAFKGTSLPWFSFTTDDVNDQFGQFSKVDQFDDLSISSNDKVNDNLYFSCCFYKHKSPFGSCDECFGYKNKGGQGTCCTNCYKETVNNSYNYMNIADNIVSKIKEYIDFENSLVIFTGHSLGGTLASMMGLMYNKLAVAFESPGDKHYIELVGLGDIPSDNIYHFGHDADPLFIGTCGMTCSTLGYYVNTKCHVGNTCSFSSKEKLGYSESILKHRIDYVINNIIPHWETDFPECVKLKDCADCEGWTYT